MRYYKKKFTEVIDKHIFDFMEFDKIKDINKLDNFFIDFLQIWRKTIGHKVTFKYRFNNNINVLIKVYDVWSEEDKDYPFIHSFKLYINGKRIAVKKYLSESLKF